MKEQWKGFRGGNWCNRIDVADFIQNNYKIGYIFCKSIYI